MNSLVEKLGYKVHYSPIETNYSNHTKKIIMLKSAVDAEQKYILAHELGHCIIHRIIKFKRIKNKALIFVNELGAWIIAFFICLKYKAFDKKTSFLCIARECLKTYIS